MAQAVVGFLVEKNQSQRNARQLQRDKTIPVNKTTVYKDSAKTILINVPGAEVDSNYTADHKNKQEIGRGYKDAKLQKKNRGKVTQRETEMSIKRDTVWFFHVIVSVSFPLPLVSETPQSLVSPTEKPAPAAPYWSAPLYKVSIKSFRPFQLTLVNFFFRDTPRGF